MNGLFIGRFASPKSRLFIYNVLSFLDWEGEAWELFRVFCVVEGLLWQTDAVKPLEYQFIFQIKTPAKQNVWVSAPRIWFVHTKHNHTSSKQVTSVPLSTQTVWQNINWLLLIGWFEWTFVRFPTCPRTRNEKSWNGPEKWFQDDFRLENLFLSIPGSWAPV